MEVTAWLCDAQSGDVKGRLPLNDGARFTSRLGGGTFSAEVPLGNLTTRSGASPDLVTLRGIVDWCDGGRRTVMLTSGTTVLGEWLIWQHRRPAPTGMLPISGFEWAGYPKFRSLNDDYTYTTATDIGTIARRLLQDAFSSYQSTKITVPAFTAGSKMAIDYRSHTGYYSDVLEDLEDSDPGLEWHVSVSANWSGGVPTRAVRTVVWGAPEITRPSSVRIVMSSPGERGGNAVTFERSRDFSKYAQSLYGWGAGEGAKQKWVGLSDPTLTNQGYLIVTKNVTFPGTVKPAQLTSLTRRALKDAQQLWEPTTASLDPGLMGGWLRVGDRVDCKVGWSWTFPDGYSGTLRVGEVSFETGPGGTVDLQLA